MSKVNRGNNDRVHRRRAYGVLMILAGILALAAVWNLPHDAGEIGQMLPARLSSVPGCKILGMC